jgi:hypothetical protein
MIKTALTALRLGRTILAHPLTQVGLAAAPLLFTEPVKQRAREATLKAAFHAGQMSRSVVDRVTRR